MKTNAFTALLLNVSLIALCGARLFAQTGCVPANNAPGSLDTCFGNGGMVLTAVPFPVTGFIPRKTAIQSDGRILGVFSAKYSDSTFGFTQFIVRYNPDGSIDTGFGSSGFVYLNWNSTQPSHAAFNIAVQRVGSNAERILVVGSVSAGKQTSALRADRFLTDGSIDYSFGTNGSTILAGAVGEAMAIQPADQKILAIGDAGVLARLNADGTPDNTFGSRGISQAKPGISGQTLAVQADGKILAGGTTQAGQGQINYFMLVRYNSNGTLDDGGRADSTPGNSFGTAGKSTVNFPGYSYAAATDLVIDSNNLIVAAGVARPDYQHSDICLARFNSAGQLDLNFNGTGKSIFDRSAWDNSRDISLQGDGKIVLSGISNNLSGNQDLAAVRFASDGLVDSTFGQSALVLSDFLGSADSLAGGNIQIDPACACEKIVQVGVARTAGMNYITAVRYVP